MKKSEKITKGNRRRKRARRRRACRQIEESKKHVDRTAWVR